MNTPMTVKQGDSVPLNGRVKITDDCGTDIAGNEDFSLWEISAQLRDSANVLVYDLQPAFVEKTPVFIAEIPSSITQDLVIGKEYTWDFRFKEPNGSVSSTPTRRLRVLAAVSATPA